MVRFLSRAGFTVLAAVLCCAVRSPAQSPPAALPPQPVSTAAPIEGPATREAVKEPTITSLNPSFFVLTEAADNGGSNAVMSIGVADEIRKTMKPLLGAAPWIIPEPGWKADDLSTQCHNVSKALGGVIVTYYTGAASHFFLIYQEETQSFYLTAEIIACNHPAGTADATPTVVGVIAELPGSNGTPWVVRRSQVSVPLVSFAGIAAILSKGTVSSRNTNATTAAIVASLFTQASNRDIPGYSTPLKLRHGAQNVGVDLVRALRDLCTTHADVSDAAAARPRDNLCTYLGFTLDPAKVAEQQAALDALEEQERRGGGAGAPPKP